MINPNDTIGWFIPDAIRSDEGPYQRARLLVCFLLAFTALSVISSAGLIAANSFSSIDFQLGYLPPTVNIFLGLASLFLFRRTGSFALAGNMFVLPSFVGIVFTSSFNYLHFESPAFQVFPLVVVFAFLLCGQRWGVVWAVVVSCTVVALGALQSPLSGNSSGRLEQQLATVHLVVGGFFFFALALGLAIYDRLHRRLRHSINEERERYLQLSRHDDLTGLRNQQSFSVLLNQSLSLAQFTGETVSVVYIDLDGFKPVNDKYGHATGDAVLLEVARRLKHCVRKGDNIARLGGDEFGIILHSAGSDCAAGLEQGELNVRAHNAQMKTGQVQEVPDKNTETILHAIHAELTRTYDINGFQITIGASIGIAVGSGRIGQAGALIAAADASMYRAKRNGGGVCSAAESGFRRAA